MKKIFALVLLSMPLWLLGQRVPDNDAVLRAVIDHASPYYYPPLFSRYMAGDTTLTEDDYYYLYYGFPYQEEYNLPEANPAADKVMTVFAQNNEPDSAQCARIIEYVGESMKADPFSPRNVNFLIYAYEKLGDRRQAEINRDRLDKIVATIKSSGTGLRQDSPWHVLFFSHSTDVLAMMDLQPMKRMVVTSTVEYIPLLQRHGKVKGYYFDFGRVYWRKPDKLREKRVQGLEFNGIPLYKKKGFGRP